MSNSVIGYNFGAQGPTGNTGGTGANGLTGPYGPSGSIGNIGPIGSPITKIEISDFNQDGDLDIRTTYSNGVVIDGPGVIGTNGSLGPSGETVFELFTETLGTEEAVVNGTIGGCYQGTIQFKSITGTGGIVVTEDGNEIFVTYKNFGVITGVTGGLNQIAYMGGSAGNSADALLLVRGATGFSYNKEFNSVSAISRNYKEVGHRFTMNEVSGGSITDTTRLVEFNVNPSMRLGITYNQEDPYGSNGPWGNVWYIDVDQLYTSQVPGAETPLGDAAPFVKINDITATADKFNNYFGGGSNRRVSAFTLVINGGSNEPRSDGFSSDGNVFPANWIFPYGERPVLTEAKDIYQFFSNGTKNENGIVWYGMALKSQPGKDIFFPTY